MHWRERDSTCTRMLKSRTEPLRLRAGWKKTKANSLKRTSLNRNSKSQSRLCKTSVNHRGHTPLKETSLRWQNHSAGGVRSPEWDGGRNSLYIYVCLLYSVLMFAFKYDETFLSDTHFWEIILKQHKTEPFCSKPVLEKAVYIYIYYCSDLKKNAFHASKLLEPSIKRHNYSLTIYR